MAHTNRISLLFLKPTVYPDAPDAPSISLEGQTGTTITVSWDAVDNATSYKIYVDGVLVGGTPSLSYTVTGLTENTSYDITVKAHISTGPGNDSAASNTITQLTSPAAPVLTNVSHTSSTIVVSWPAVAGAAHYRIFKAGVLVDADATSPYTVSGLSGSTSYAITAVARNSDADDSALSNTITQTTDADNTGDNLRAALLAEYNFDGVLTDSSGNGKNLSVTAGSASYTTGKVGANSLSCPAGLDYFSTAAALIASGSFWISVWVNWTNTSFRGICSQADDGVGASGTFALDNTFSDGTKPRFTLLNTLSVSTALTWGSATNDGNWHLVNAWFDGTNINLNVDNGTTLSTPMVGTARYDATLFRAASAYNPGSFLWLGLLDALHIFNRAPAAGELDYLWNSGNGIQLN